MFVTYAIIISLSFNLLSRDEWWTGVIIHTLNNVWVWDHSGDELIYTNWDPNGSQPNGGNGENWVLSQADTWHDYPCDFRYNIICQR